jgi:hypothetical protein
MTLLSPGATYHAELREQLGGVGRALSVQRGIVWLARGLAAGTVIVLGVVIWAWVRDVVSSLPLALLIGVPIGAAFLTAMASLSIRHNTRELARRVDRAAQLHERSTTALELGARGEDFPLALAQMRDAVEHLKRVDLLEAFPLRLPRTELLASFFMVVIAVIVAFSPNPWLLRARAANPAITTAREQAQRVQRLADSIQPQDSAELNALRQLVSKGAQTIDARSNEPDAALNALQDLEEQVRQMSAGDDQLSSALAAVAAALASDPATQQLASAINTGDMRQIAQAAKDLAQASRGLSGQDQQRVAKVLRDAANQAGRTSQSVAGDLSDAADAMQAGAAGQSSDSANADPSQAGQSGQQAGAQSAQNAQNGRSASDALNQLANSAAAAGERQRASSQLESSRNALERALGRTQSRTGSSSSSSNSRSSSSSQSSQGANGAQAGDPSQGAGQGQASDQPGDGTDGNGGGAPGGDQGNGGGDNGQGGGYSTGGQNQNKTGASNNQLDTITTPQQVPSNGEFVPDESSVNPYLGDAGNGNAQASAESVQPSYSQKPTQGNDTASIPLGMRDLVKDYFSSLDQK